ncbi:MAG TPA: hypothetical protein VGD56_07020 [Gemmatirosa sp.]
MELIVVVAVLGVMTSVVGLALGTPRGAPAGGDAWRRTIAAARARALTTGRPVHVPAPQDVRAGRELLALPDGSVVAAIDSTPRGPGGTAVAERPVDRLTGHLAGPGPIGDAAP